MLINIFRDNKQYEFTYIGRLPENVLFKNIRHVKPTHGKPLAKELAAHDLYITASIEEAGANHVLEGVASGLPIIYHRLGGSIVEYCAPYGLEYDSFDECLDNIQTIVCKLYSI